MSDGVILIEPSKSGSYQLRKLMGSHDLKMVGKKYYDELVTFCDTNYVECDFDCIFTKKKCIYKINRRLREKGIELHYNGQTVLFDSLSFKNLLTKDNLYSNNNYSKRTVNNAHQTQYLHSLALIEYVTKKVESNSNSIMKELKEE